MTTMSKALKRMPFQALPPLVAVVVLVAAVVAAVVIIVVAVEKKSIFVMFAHILLKLVNIGTIVEYVLRMHSIVVKSVIVST